jgi:hypothetical protein
MSEAACREGLLNQPVRLRIHNQRAAEFSGASRRIPLPEPALITNPYPNSTQLHGYNQGFVINAG